MTRNNIFFCLLISLIVASCASENDTAPAVGNSNTIYFPPIDSTEWEKVSTEKLGWKIESIMELEDFLFSTNTKAFLILKNGRIAMEWYGNGGSASTNLPWNSAGKTLSAFMMGIAQQQDHLYLDEASQLYLGQGWSSLTDHQEKAIKIRHHLTMTTGLDYSVPNKFCHEPNCLVYLNEPGNFWFYHNAPYTITQEIIENASGKNFYTYFRNELAKPIGMQGAWLEIGFNRIYFSNARSMARFGLLCMNKANWEGNQILNKDYFTEMTSTSQEHNNAYGYLWWLNGKENFKLPESVETFPGKLIPNAPNDLIAGLGANDQKLYIVPSHDLVIVRMGDEGTSSHLISYDHQLWEKINQLIN